MRQKKQPNLDTFPTDPQAAVLVEDVAFCAVMVDVLTKIKGAREARFFLCQEALWEFAWRFKASVRGH